MRKFYSNTMAEVRQVSGRQGISIARDKNQMRIFYNRASRNVPGMVRGFYEEDGEKIHGMFVYDRS